MFKLFVTVTFILLGQPGPSETIWTNPLGSAEQCNDILLDTAIKVVGSPLEGESKYVTELREFVQEGMEVAGADDASLTFVCKE